jgi:hypothetical protein
MKPLRKFSHRIVLIVFALALVAVPAARSQEAEDNAPAGPNANVRVARLSFFYGGAQVEIAGQGWQDAQVNLPLQEGSRVKTDDGRAELQFDDGSLLRLAQNTTVELMQLAMVNGSPSTKINLLSGTVIAEGRLGANDSVRVLTPVLSVDIANGASVRVDVTEGNSWVTVISGEIQVGTPGGVYPVSEGNMLHLGPDGKVSTEQSPAADDFDTWVSDRDHLLASGESSSEPYIQSMESSAFYSAISDLSQFGYWGSYPGYGVCWVPFGTPVGWMPFGIGSFRFMPHLGWTWISAEPWGWLPYHFGSWFYTPHGWAWSPNPVRFFNPAPVQWVSVDNQRGWIPAGTFAPSRRPAGTAGFVLGGEPVDGIIRSERGTGALNPISNGPSPVIVASRVPAPSVPDPRNAHSSTTIVYDPVTRTYVNGSPRPVQPAPRADENRIFAGNENTNGEDSREHKPAAARPQFGPPAGYSSAAVPGSLPESRPPAEERERTIHPAGPSVRPSYAPSRTGTGAPVMEHPAPMVHSAPPRVAAPPHVSAPAPHH